MILPLYNREMNITYRMSNFDTLVEAHISQGDALFVSAVKLGAR